MPLTVTSAGEALAADQALGRVDIELVCNAWESSPWAVRRVEISEELSGHCEATVWLYNTDLGADDEQLLVGSSASVILSRPDCGARRLSGFITTVTTHGITADRQRRCVVKIVPAFQCLQQVLWQKWTDKTVPDILSEVLTEALKPFDREVEFRLSRAQLNQPGSDRFPVREYTSQRAETICDFVRRLCSEEGLALWYDHSGEHEKLIISDSNSQFDKHGSDINLVAPGASAQTEEHIASLALTYQRVPRAVAVNRLDLTRPNLTLLAKAEAKATKDRPGKAPEPEIYDPTRVALHDYQGEQYRDSDGPFQSRIRLEEVRRDAVVGTGQSTVLAFRPGLVVQVTNPYGTAAPTDGVYLLTALTHVAEIPTVGDEARVSEYSNAFTCMPFSVPFRPQSLPRPHATVDHAVVAAVSSTDGIHHDVHGRVRVKFSWDRTPGEPSEKDSGWIPVLSPWAGAGRGMQCLPRKGDVLVVQYELGDPDRPVAVASVPTGSNRLLYGLDQKTKVALRTQSQRIDDDGTLSTPHFNELSMDDAAGAELLMLRAGWDYRRLVLNDSHVDIKRHEGIVVGHSQTVEVGRRRATTIGTRDKEGHANGEDRTDVVGTRLLDVAGHDLVTVEQEHQLTVGQDRRTTIGKQGHPAKDILLVRGSMETTVESSTNLHVKVDSKATVDGEYRLQQAATVLSLKDGHIDINSTGKVRLVRGSVNVIIDAKDNVTVCTSAKVTVQASEIALEGDKISIDAKHEAKLCVGSTEIKLDPQGVTVSGTNICQTAGSVHQTTAPLIAHN